MFHKRDFLNTWICANAVSDSVLFLLSRYFHSIDQSKLDNISFHILHLSYFSINTKQGGLCFRSRWFQQLIFLSFELRKAFDVKKIIGVSYKIYKG